MIRPLDYPQRELREVANYLKLESNEQALISGICSDSRLVETGDLFLAMPGETAHGIAFLDTALERGARAILTDSEGASHASRVAPSVPLLVNSNPRSLCADLSDWFYSHPSSKLKLFGITGTNGKTTTSYLLHQIWNSSNFAAGLIGTVAILAGNNSWKADRTTPMSDELQRILARMVDEKIENVAMEVSSHALVQERVKKVRFEGVGFTNLTQDHLDYHKTMENYYQAKKLLFSEEYADTAYINVDNDFGKRLISEISIEARALSISDKSDWHFGSFQRSGGGYEVKILSKEGNSISGKISILGRHNLENLLMAVAMASASGLSDEAISNSLEKLTGAPGRLELVIQEPFLAFVDYAHTPDAVSKILESIKDLEPARIIGVLGCGGDRDKGKRPLMGQALNLGCDLPIFTSDNPRSESPEEILKDMTGGIELKESAEIIPDRREAIMKAVSLAKPGDLLIVLGKGHELGQEISGVKMPFSDREELLKAVATK